jgi:hypothetical protein
MNSLPLCTIDCPVPFKGARGLFLGALALAFFSLGMTTMHDFGFLSDMGVSLTDIEMNLVILSAIYGYYLWVMVVIIRYMWHLRDHGFWLLEMSDNDFSHMLYGIANWNAARKHWEEPNQKWNYILGWIVIVYMQPMTRFFSLVKMLKARRRYERELKTNGITKILQESVKLESLFEPSFAYLASPHARESWLRQIEGAVHGYPQDPKSVDLKLLVKLAQMMGSVNRAEIFKALLPKPEDRKVLASTLRDFHESTGGKYGDPDPLIEAIL